MQLYDFITTELLVVGIASVSIYIYLTFMV